MSTGFGREGEKGQHIIATRSMEQGKTWSFRVDIESADDPESSWAIPLITPTLRVYVFYTYNLENQLEVITDDLPYRDGLWMRVDSFGEYAFRYSDDGGLAWSTNRYFIPSRCERWR